MTTPSERTRAVLGMTKSIKALAPYSHGRGETVRVPRDLLRDLQAWMRHYPTPAELEWAAEKMPDLWGKP